MARVLIPLADGVEEMEAVIMIDTLRRAAWDVTSAAVAAAKGREVHASRGVVLVADSLWKDVQSDTFDALLVPGGAGGADVLRRHAGVRSALRAFAAAGKWVGAICAGPLVLQDAGILKGRRATCHPAVQASLRAGTVVSDRVVRDGNVLTSRGPGTAFEFALALIDAIDGADAAERVAAGLVLPGASA